MTDTTPTRRTVLRSTSVAVTGTAIVGQASAEAPTVRTVETGIGFEVDRTPELVGIHSDSRPEYAVDTGRRELVFDTETDSETPVAAADAGALVAERPTAPGESQSLFAAGQSTTRLVTDFSGRMRPMESLSLVEPTTVPRASVTRKGRTPRLVVPSEGTVELPPGSDRTVRLPPRSVEVKTVRTTDEKVEVEGVPERRWGYERVFGSRTVEATPFVRAVDHGELELTRRQLP
ncbi:MAG: hypothetical protein ABEI75_01690, partial [Halobaculum sp.]